MREIPNTRAACVPLRPTWISVREIASCRKPSRLVCNFSGRSLTEKQFANPDDSSAWGSHQTTPSARLEALTQTSSAAEAHGGRP